jgi:16S rRNA G966 N2-methylase RsmD
VRGELVLGLEGDYAERARQRMRAGVRPDPTEIFPEGSQKGETRDHLAALAEMSGRTLDKIKHLLAEAPAAVLAELRAGALKSIDKAYATIGREERQRKREEAKAEAARRSTIPATIALADWRDWLPSQPTCDLLLTDPPYSTDVDDIEKFAKAWLPLALGKVKDTGRAYVCIGAYPDELRAYLNIKTPKHLIFEQVLVWTYRNTIGPSPKQNYKLNWQAILYYRGIKSGDLDCPEMKEQFSVQYINAPDGRLGDRYHAWQKPDALAERFIRHALPKGGVMLDPFAGTGTFLTAAARLEREAHGCDIDPTMLQLAIERGCSNA